MAVRGRREAPPDRVQPLVAVLEAGVRTHQPVVARARANPAASALHFPEHVSGSPATTTVAAVPAAASTTGSLGRSQTKKSSSDGAACAASSAQAGVHSRVGNTMLTGVVGSPGTVDRSDGTVIYVLAHRHYGPVVRNRSSPSGAP